jgi:regulator of nonsense transcripts 1
VGIHTRAVPQLLSQPDTLDMDSFDNFQYESASSYGPLGIIDDNSSVYTANTQEITSLDLESLSISDAPGASPNGHIGSKHPTPRIPLDEDFDGVLDDLKEENAVVLPPHACRYAILK